MTDLYHLPQIHENNNFSTIRQWHMDLGTPPKIGGEIGKIVNLSSQLVIPHPIFGFLMTSNAPASTTSAPMMETRVNRSGTIMEK